MSATNAKRSLEIEYIAPAELKIRKQNANRVRRPNTALGRFVQKNDFSLPIAIDEDNNILAGHRKRQQALMEGMQAVPCIRLIGLDDKQKVTQPTGDAAVDLRFRDLPLSKQIFDRVAAALALVCLSPLFLCLMLLVKRDGGPAFYGQRRITRYGREFRCWKFRSMVTNSAEVLEHILATDPEARAEWERDVKLKNDPRVTKVGAFLRKTSLDELPQLMNIIRGEMSIVGPRPVTEKELAFYGRHIAEYVSVNPGLTGLWQISGRNDVSYEERVRMDADYVGNWSFFSDIGIIFKTILVMVRRSGAY